MNYNGRDFLLLILVISWSPLTEQNHRSNDARNTRIASNRVRRESNQNVSCIAHDVKFTCDCRDANQPMYLPQLSGSVFQVEITNCDHLTLVANVLEHTQGLRKVTFRNIAHLILKRNALSFPQLASNTPLIIDFEQVQFDVIDSHAVNGNIEEISIIGGRIDLIHPFGFTTLNDRAVLLKMENVSVKRIEPQAFKKFSVDEMEITNCVFEMKLPSKAFYELEVLKMLRINNVNFNEVHSRAFSFKLVAKLSISNNHFYGVDAEWIEAHLRETSSIRNNNFGVTSQIAFRGITLHRDYIANEKLDLHFKNNTVRFPQQAARPLDFSNRFNLNIEQLRYENTFSCNDLNTSFKPPHPRVEFFQRFADKISFQRNDNNQSFLSLSKIIESECRKHSHLLYILLAILALVVVVVIIVAVVVWQRISNRKKRRKIDVVLPEPRTYKETQIIYQIENAGLLKTDL